MNNRNLNISLYVVLAALGIAIAAVGAIWGIAHSWYHITDAVRMTIAVVVLILSQVGVAVAMFQEKQGTLMGEIAGLVHCLVVFVAVAMTEQTFYIGWDTASYIELCGVLCLPAVYLLRSIACSVVYSASILIWAAFGGPLNAFGGTAAMWVLLLGIAPFYNTLSKNSDEVRLSIFSWVVTITVFAAFAMAARTEEYIPFLLLSALAVAIMLTGYSIDIKKAWGVPFRWFGRFAAAGSLLISAIPSSWVGIANIQGFHWTSTLVTVILFIAIVGLLAKGVYRRLWAPVIYSGIPVLILLETALVRGALYSSIPLILSSLYLLLLGCYEIISGTKSGFGAHLKFGVVILISLVAAFFMTATVSALVPILAIVILGLLFVQIRTTRSSRKAAALRKARHIGTKHKGAVVRGGRKRPKKKHKDVTETADVPKADDLLEARNAAEDADTLAEWMKDVHMPDIPLDPEPAPADDKAEAAVEGDVAQTSAPAQTVVKHEEPVSPFVPPVFHAPEEVPVVKDIPQPKPLPRKEAAPVKEGPKKHSGSPWGTMPQPAKREKHFTHSPWSQEGDRK